MIQEVIKKYTEDKNPIRLDILLEIAGKKPTKKNRQALELLITDGNIKAIESYLGLGKQDSRPQAKEEGEQIVLEEFKHNQDDFTSQVIRILGKPDDSNSLGNRILTGETYTGHLKTNIKPSILLNKFATLAGKDQILIDEHPNFKSNPPIWEFAIAGTKPIQRFINHKVDG